MTKRFLLLTAVVLLVGAVGALATFGPLEFGATGDIESAEPLVRHSSGVAHAAGAPLMLQQMRLQGGGGAAQQQQEDQPVEEPVEDVKPIGSMSEEEKIELLNEWKTRDPRELIEEKYADLESRKTRPMDEDSPDFIPDTGRTDPLTRVRSEVPNELKPPRAEEGEGNQLESYLDNRAASQIVEGVGMSIQCWQVFHIGLQRLVTLSVGTEFFQLSQGGPPVQFPVWSETGRLIVVYISLVSSSADEVVVSVTAMPQDTNIVISQTYNFLPR